MSRNTRPTKAGLNGLLPSPPKLILPMPMATNAPMTTIHTGRLLGRLNDSNRPVSTADPSLMVGVVFSRKRWMRYSNNTHESTEVTLTMNAPRPKK